MPKALCWIGIAISIIVLLFFLADLAFRMPFHRFNPWVNVIFIVSAVILGIFSWTTLKEQE